MRFIMAALGIIAFASCGSNTSLPLAHPTRIVLKLRAEKSIPSCLIDQLADAVRQAVAVRAEVDIERFVAELRGVELSVPGAVTNVDAVAQAAITACIECGITQISVLGPQGENRCEYHLLSTIGDLDRLLEAKASFVLWFHADWASSGPAFEKWLVRDVELVAAIGRNRLPLVRIDYTHPDDATIKAIERYSRSRIVPTVVVFRGPEQPPTVFEGVLSVRQVRGALDSQAVLLGRTDNGKRG
jgi:hypothetical protein